VRKADNLPPSCAVVTKSGNLNFLEPSGPDQACNGTALPLHIALYTNRVTSTNFLVFLVSSWKGWGRMRWWCILKYRHLPEVRKTTEQLNRMPVLRRYWNRASCGHVFKTVQPNPIVLMTSGEIRASPT